jgi:signal transduction histidine kinase
MNPISAFLVDNMVAIYFFYGLAFFVLGLALIFSGRQSSEFRFARAIVPLAAFGVLHGLHEWIEMFQIIASQTGGDGSVLWVNICRLLLLTISFLMLLAFGVVLLTPKSISRIQRFGPLVLMVVVWLAAVLLVRSIFNPQAAELVVLADVLSRYIFGIPAALLGTWALMVQQHAFRERNMPQFGRDLVWCACALFLYGVVGQVFVQQSVLVPSTILNSDNFLLWFGIPVQLFRGLLATFLTVFMVRALRAFELENQQRLDQANQAKLVAQQTALEAVRRTSTKMENLNEELQLAVHELTLLLDLSRLLAEPMDLRDRLWQVADRIVQSIEYADAALILLRRQNDGTPYVAVSLGFKPNTPAPQLYLHAQELGHQCIIRNLAICRHKDGRIIEFVLDSALQNQDCRRHRSSTLMIALPLAARKENIGCLVLIAPENVEKTVSADEFALMVGIGQQIGLSIENASLAQDVQKREKMLAELLHQVVGAQEAERRRIARELHDATGQSLTAIALGLRGIESLVVSGSPVEAEQIRDLQAFGTNAIGELRQIIADLRPSQLDDLGLVAALRWYIQAFEKRRGIHAEFVVNGNPGRLLSEYETVLFRIVQEALTNVAKHAAASRVVVTLDTFAHQICLIIEDDGRGFDVETVMNGDNKLVGWGLMGIRERTLLLGGKYIVESAPGEGTVIHVSVPFIMETQQDVKDSITIG